MSSLTKDESELNPQWQVFITKTKGEVERFQQIYKRLIQDKSRENPKFFSEVEKAYSSISRLISTLQDEANSLISQDPYPMDKRNLLFDPIEDLLCLSGDFLILSK